MIKIKIFFSTVMKLKGHKYKLAMAMRTPFGQSSTQNQHTNVGVVASRKAALENASREGTAKGHTDVLGHNLRNKEVETQIQALTAQLEAERASKKALAEKTKEAEQAARHFEHAAKEAMLAMTRAEERAAQSAAMERNGMKDRYADLKAERLAKKAMKPVPRAAPPRDLLSKAIPQPRSKAQESYLKFAKANRAPHMNKSATQEYLRMRSSNSEMRTPCRDGSISVMNTPNTGKHSSWHMKTPRTHLTSVQRMGSVNRENW